MKGKRPEGQYPRELWAKAFAQAATELGFPARGQKGCPENKQRQKMYQQVYRRALAIAKGEYLETNTASNAG